MKRKELFFAGAFVLTAALLLSVAGAALRPVRTDFGAVWKPYLAEPAHSLDYLYLGSSYAYCDVDPRVIYAKTGLTGYVMAGPEQTLSITYRYLKEALKTQTPQAVILEASALQFQQYQSYTQINVGYMPFSGPKLDAIWNATEPQLRTGLLFDLYFYHSRWKDITWQEALTALSPVETDKRKGYTAAEGVFDAMPAAPFRSPRIEEALYQRNLADLKKILALCDARGIRPVVVFHPTYSQLAPEDYRRVGEDIAACAPNALYCDWSDSFAAVGLDPQQHFFDPGHLNQAGAVTFSAFLGAFLRTDLALTQTRLAARLSPAGG